jgi:hypothetical protein
MEVLGSELPELAHRVGECEAAIWSLWGEKRTRRMHGQNDVIDRERTTRSTSGVHARQLTFGTLRDAVLRIRQSNSSNPLTITMAATVPAMYAQRDGPEPALLQHDRGVTDRYDGGYQHEPTKGVCGPVSYEHGGEQARCDVTNTFSGEIRSRMRLQPVRRNRRPLMKGPTEIGCR